MQPAKPRLRINSEDVDGPPSIASAHSCDSDTNSTPLALALDSDYDYDNDNDIEGYKTIDIGPVKALTHLLEDFEIEFDTSAITTV